MSSKSVNKIPKLTFAILAVVLVVASSISVNGIGPKNAHAETMVAPNSSSGNNGDSSSSVDEDTGEVVSIDNSGEACPTTQQSQTDTAN